jgi:hypothetical protein
MRFAEEFSSLGSVHQSLCCLEKTIVKLFFLQKKIFLLSFEAETTLIMRFLAASSVKMQYRYSKEAQTVQIVCTLQKPVRPRKGEYLDKLQQHQVTPIITQTLAPDLSTCTLVWDPHVVSPHTLRSLIEEAQGLCDADEDARFRALRPAPSPPLPPASPEDSPRISRKEAQKAEQSRHLSVGEVLDPLHYKCSDALLALLQQTTRESLIRRIQNNTKKVLPAYAMLIPPKVQEDPRCRPLLRGDCLEHPCFVGRGGHGLYFQKYKKQTHVKIRSTVEDLRIVAEHDPRVCFSALSPAGEPQGEPTIVLYFNQVISRPKNHRA